MSCVLRALRELQVRGAVESAADRKSSTLDVSAYEVDRLPAPLYACRDLEHLYLHRNKLTSLTVQLTQLTNLTTLTLDYNNLTSLPPEIGDLKNLLNLNISYNPLKVLLPEIGNLENLEAFWCNRIEIKELPREIGNLSKLDTLGARGNALTGLPDEMTKLTKLRWLTLENNQLERLPENMEGMELLVHLNVKRNRLRGVPLGLSRLADLMYLQLNDNMIECLPEGFETAAMLSLEVIDLRGNPICDSSPPVSGCSSEEYELASINTIARKCSALRKMPEFHLKICHEDTSVIRYTENWPPAETPSPEASTLASESSRHLAAQTLAINATALRIPLGGPPPAEHQEMDQAELDLENSSLDSSEDWENSVASSELDEQYRNDEERIDNEAVGMVLPELSRFASTAS